MALQQAPGDVERAQVLSTVLAVRAALDENFRIGLERWHEQARLIRAGDGNVVNEINGGTFHEPVMQGRDIFFTAAPRPATPDEPCARG
ncbi:hypothetical protein ABZX74_30245 [Streptomyces olivaceoviridis]|uniref:hypothetical protein n=1 Tax=Streptomyces olivaceoviridis TaxID=1921 RepID=UPI0033B7BB25